MRHIGSSEGEHVVCGEVCGYATSVRLRREANCLLVGLKFKRNIAAGNFNHKPQRLAWQRSDMPCGDRGTALGGHRLGLKLIAKQIEAKAMRCQLLRHRTPRRGTRLGGGLRMATDRKENRISVISEPWAQLMCATETLNASCPGIKHPRGIFRRLDRPVSHAKWPGGDRQSVTAGESKCGVRSLKRVCCTDAGPGSFCRVGRPDRRGLRCRRRCTYRGAGDRQAGALEKPSTPHPHGGQCAIFTHDGSMVDEAETGLQPFTGESSPSILRGLWIAGKTEACLLDPAEG